MPQLQNQIQFQVQFQDQFQFQEQGLQSQKRHITLQENPATPKRRKGQPIAAASRADVVASMANKTAYATHNKIACTLVLQEAAKDREKSLARRTVYHYQQYQRHWVDWCERKHFMDGDMVTYEKFLLYVRELVAEESVQAEDDFYSIKPLRVNVTIDYEGDLPSPETVDAYVKSVISLYQSQRALVPNPSNQPWASLRTAEFRGIISSYRKRYQQSNKFKNQYRMSVDNAYTPAQLKQFLKLCWTRSYKPLNGGAKTHKLLGARDRVSFALNHFLIARGQNLLDAKLSSLFPHIHATAENGRQLSFALVLEITHGKTNQDFTIYSSCIRNKDVELCPLGALGFYLLELWMDKKNVPDFHDDKWMETFLIFGASDRTRMSSTSLYKAMKGVMNKAGHHSDKVTHAGRKAGAQHAMLNGSSHDQISQQGNWLHSRLAIHYLHPVPRAVPYSMAGFTRTDEEFWLPRNTLIPDPKLQRMIFPFIENLFEGNKDWEQRIENIMMDRPEDYNRPLLEQTSHCKEEIPKIRFNIILAHFRKIILQDMAVLMEITDNANCYYQIYRMHHICQMPVFQSPEFGEFSAKLRQTMSEARSPSMDSLAANAPAIAQKLDVLGAQLSALDDFIRSRERVDTSNCNLTSSFRTHMSSVNRQLVALSQGIEGAFNGAGRTIGHTVSEIKSIQREQIREFDLQIQQGCGAGQRSPFTPEQGHTDGHLVSHEPAHEQASVTNTSSPLQGEDSFFNEVDGAREREEEVVVEQRQAHSQSQPQSQSGMQGRVDLDQLAEQIAMLYVQIGTTLSSHEMLPQAALLKDQWKEWFHGVDGRPSIWALNKSSDQKRAKWRSGFDAQKRKLYQFKKELIEAVLEEISKSTCMTLVEKEADALTSVSKAIINAGSNNSYIKMRRAQRKKAFK